MIDNPYEREYYDVISAISLKVDRGFLFSEDYIRLFASTLARRERREDLVGKFAWAIPNAEAVAMLVQCSPLVEVGAGGGYWAWLVRQAGGDIVAYDWRPRAQPWTEVLEGGPARVRLHADRTLFLCWPPYSTSMARECLDAYTGRRVIYVGEMDGCTADAEFHERLQADWRLVREISIPNWDGIYDSMYVFRRRTRKERRR